jgi:hypothetical protein
MGAEKKVNLLAHTVNSQEKNGDFKARSLSYRITCTPHSRVEILPLLVPRQKPWIMPGERENRDSLNFCRTAPGMLIQSTYKRFHCLV